jgi:hypothetical protein
MYFFPLTFAARLRLAHLEALRYCESRRQAEGADYDPCADYVMRYRLHMNSTRTAPL